MLIFTRLLENIRTFNSYIFKQTGTLKVKRENPGFLVSSTPVVQWAKIQILYTVNSG